MLIKLLSQTIRFFHCFPFGFWFAIMSKLNRVFLALSHLTALLGENEVITRFQQLQKRVAENDTLQQLEEGIKAAQKDAVQFAHYGKPEA
jgi:cell fate (sporulation/competence/biofilm development) regulator YmcA (YheA/YmcA/DUF963 family)